MVNLLHNGHWLPIDLTSSAPVLCRYNWVATGSIDQTLIIWDLAHQAIRSTCEHDVGVEINRSSWSSLFFMSLRAYCY
jgi:WD40 repeat protein